VNISNIENKGVISGKTETLASDFILKSSVGNGVKITGRILDVESINNSGTITGETTSNYFEENEDSNYSTDSSGNGVLIGSQRGYGYVIDGGDIYTLALGSLENSGIISGKNIDKPSANYTSISGNGFAAFGDDTYMSSGISVKSILNRGVLSGYSTTSDNSSDVKRIFDNLNGNGILLSTNNEVIIKNYGLIAGSNKGIYGNNLSTENYGVIAGSVDSDGTLNNKGLLITVDNSGSILSFQNGTEGVTADGKTIINGTIVGTEAVLNSSELVQSSALVINGASSTAGALNVDKNTVLSDSIINGYNSAVYLNAEKTLNATDVIFNGGGLKNNIPVIKGDLGNNTILISGNKSIINGDVNLEAGDDSFAVSNGTLINGNLYGGEGVDILALGDGTNDLNSTLNNHDGNADGIVDYGDYRGLAIYNKIDGFENIDVKGAVTLYETAKISGDANIVIKAGSNLNLRIDPTQKDSLGRVIGHALYSLGNKTITTEAHAPGSSLEEYRGDDAPLTGGTLNIITNGLGTGGVIAMSSAEANRVAETSGSTILDSSKENLYLKTDSIIHSATVKIDDALKASGAITGDIVVTLNPDLITIPKPKPEPEPETPKIINYNQLNKIYRSLIADAYNVDSINLTATSGNVAFENLLHLLNEIYTNSPYSFSNELARESMNMYSDVLIENPFKARDKKWMIYGGLLHENIDLENSYETKNYHQFKGTAVDADNKITGAYSLAEYGLDSSLSLGGILGGSNNKTDISNHSSLDGNAFYIGTYFKKDIKDLRILGGVGYQFSNYDSKRVASNSLQSFSYSESYDDKGLNLYLSGRYNYSLGNSYYLVPKVKLSYTNISQDSIKEKDAALSIDVNSESFSVVEGSLGFDLKKEFLHKGGKSALKLGAEYNRILKGADDQYLSASMKNGDNFDLLVPSKVKNTYSIGAGYEFENEKGILFHANTKYSFKVSENSSIREGVDSHNSRKGWSIGAGIGYRY
ncbi:MAG: autotransporter domain-containing protein, partial [Fusobacteriaceae bacterium]